MKVFIRELIKGASTLIVVFGAIILHFFQLMKEFNSCNINLHGMQWLPSTIIGFYIAMVVFAVMLLLWIFMPKKNRDKTKEVEE